MGNTKQRLKPCPFCGSPARFRMKYSKKYQGYFVFVKCYDCSACSGMTLSKTNPCDDGWKSEACKYAADAWNKRTGQQPGAED